MATARDACQSPAKSHLLQIRSPKVTQIAHFPISDFGFLWISTFGISDLDGRLLPLQQAVS
jgi:hypothetical protein